MPFAKKIVAVTGATGRQGGSVVDALLESGQYEVRAVVRNPNPEKIKPLLDRGVEIVEGNFDNKDSLIEAFKGPYAVFAVTDFFEPFQKHGAKEAEKRELAQAKNLAEAAAGTSGLFHYVWSTLPSFAKVSGGKYYYPHFESKAAADEYILSHLPDLAAKTTFLWVSGYASNMTSQTMVPNLLKTIGKYGWVQPIENSTPITLIGDERKNVGIFVEAILSQPALTRGGKYLLAEVETLTNQELLDCWEKVTGKPTVYIQSTLETYEKLFPGWGLEIGEMMQFWQAFREASWSKPAVTPLRKEDLGIDTSRLISTEAALAKIDWSKL